MLIRTLILLLYFFSGFSALVYEIVWARMLGLVIGTTVAAWGTILAVYMGGMALGSAIGGSTVDRASRPLRLFALCEAGIGLFGSISPALFRLSERMVMAAQPLGMPGVTRVMIVGGMLLIPTMLMGCTLPAISRAFFSEKSRFGGDLGLIYSVNTCGAFAGAFASGFMLVPAFGLSSSLLLAAGVNLCVAAAALLLAPGPGRDIRAVVPAANNTAGSALPVWLFPSLLACSGFCAMALEVLWSRGLVFFLSSTTYAFTTVLSVVLLGLVFGAVIATFAAKKIRNPVYWIAALQGCIGILAFSSPWILHHIDRMIHFAGGFAASSWPEWLAIRYMVCFVIIFPPALCMGATFPLAVGASVGSLATSGRTVGRLSSLNTLGGIVGALAAAFLLVPIAGIQRSFLPIALFSCAAGVAALAAAARRLPAIAAGLVATAALFALSALFTGRNPMILYSSVVRESEGPISLISCWEDRTASVAVLKTEQGRVLNIDGFNAAGTWRYEYMHLLAHLPVLLSPSPDTALVICLGTGTTCGTAGLYPAVKRVDCVEISPAVIAAACNFSDVNHDAAANPKIKIYCDDGRNHLLRTRRHYDIITLEPMHPYLASATNLYSADFYRLCHARLSRHGVMAQWAPMHVLSTREYRMLIASFLSVFPHTSLWFLGTEGVLIGTMDSLRIDIRALRERMSPEAVKADLERISLDAPERLLACFLMDERRVREYAGNAPVISDDWPAIEFSAPHNLSIPAQRLWVDNMTELVESRVPELPLLAEGDSTTMAAIGFCREASALVMKSEILNARQQFFDAVMLADSALSLMPRDTTATMVRQEAAGYAVRVSLNSARLFRSRGVLPQAEREYLKALAVDSFCIAAHTELATLYNSLGMIDKGLDQAQKAVVSSPNDPALHTNLAVQYLNLNRRAEAEAELLRAVRSDPTGRGFYFLSQLYAETGRIELAQAAMERAREMGYGQK